MYESKISNLRWIVHDILGNIGWISFLIGLFLCFTKEAEIVENKIIYFLLILNFICGVLMIVGIIELISERICRLDRVLPKKRLYRGFGLLTLSGFFGMIFSFVAMTIAFLKGLSGTIYFGLLCGGAFLCFLFVGLIFMEYKRVR